MDHVLKGMDDCFVYMDDILISSKDEQSHMETIKELFDRLDKTGLAISLKKCAFGQDKLDFLGYHVTQRGSHPCPESWRP